MVEQPSGTVTLVFTDIEGSTRLLSELGASAYGDALAEHRRCVRDAFAREDGYEVDCEGDSFFYAFASAQTALSAVSEAMAALRPGPIRIRVGIHSGEPALDPPKYIGLDVHRAARIMSAGHGGQVLVSAATRALLAADAAVRDLGLHELKDFPTAEHVYQLGDGEFPPLRTLHRTNLPVATSSFLGREREVSEVEALLRGGEVRLLTLTGPGGTGKTRLALRAAAEAAAAFPDGVWWSPLAPLREADLALSVVARALGVHEALEHDLGDSLDSALRGKRLLILLDNAEHLLPGLAGPIARLLAIDGPTLLVTSRERLQLTGERVWEVPPLTGEEGVELFAERALALDGAFALTPEVGELCRRLDNLPLALELAAARTRVLSPREVLSRIAGGLDLLKGGRDADPRQQTLRATIQWSYDMLEPAEQRLLARLAVFRGGCTLESAERICDAELDGLASLVDKSLVRRTGERFWLLETIREYAAERLEGSGEAEELRVRHLAGIEALVETAAIGLRGPAQAEWLGRLDAETDNLRAALGRAEERGAVGAGLRISSQLARFWEARGHLVEAARWLTAFTEADGGDDAGRARALFWLGRLSIWFADWQTAEAQLTEALVLARRSGSADTLVLALGKLGWIVAQQGRSDESRALAEEALAYARSQDDEWILAESLNDYGVVLQYAHDFDGVRQALAESLALRRRIGDAQHVIDSLNNLGNLEMYEGAYPEAAARFDECIALSRDLGELRQLTLAVANRGSVHLLSGEPDRARPLLEENLTLCLSCGDRRMGGATLLLLAALEVGEGRPDRAARLLGASRAIHGAVPNEDEELFRGAWFGPAASKLGPEAFEALVREGDAMSFDEAAAYALGPA